MLNTPPTFAWYLAGKVFKWLLKKGGVKSIQKENEKKGGHVSISFLEKEEETTDANIYARKVLEIIQHLDDGYDLNDVCVLVRKKKEGIAVAHLLSENDIEIVLPKRFF